MEYPQFITLTHEVPEMFVSAAQRYGLEPEELARMLCADFALRPPELLRIVIAGSASEAEAA